MPIDTVYDPRAIEDIDPAVLRARIEEVRRQQAKALLHLIRSAGRHVAWWLDVLLPSALRQS